MIQSTQCVQPRRTSTKHYRKHSFTVKHPLSSVWIKRHIQTQSITSPGLHCKTKVSYVDLIFITTEASLCKCAVNRPAEWFWSFWGGSPSEGLFQTASIPVHSGSLSAFWRTNFCWRYDHRSHVNLTHHIGAVTDESQRTDMLQMLNVICIEMP